MRCTGTETCWYQRPSTVPRDGTIRTPLMKAKVGGDLACFTSIQKKDERDSYPVMTPSGARGVLEQVMWHPGIDLVISRIYVHKPIDFITLKINEIRGGRTGESVVVEDVREQRYTRALRGVEYTIEAYYRLTKDAPKDNPIKYLAMFNRRVEKGQWKKKPFLGCRQFPAWVDRADETVVPHPSLAGKTIDLGRMILGIDYDVTPVKSHDFHAELRDGVLVEHGKDRIPELKVKGF